MIFDSGWDVAIKADRLDRQRTLLNKQLADAIETATDIFKDMDSSHPQYVRYIKLLAHLHDAKAKLEKTNT